MYLLQIVFYKISNNKPYVNKKILIDYSKIAKLYNLYNTHPVKLYQILNLLKKIKKHSQNNLNPYQNNNNYKPNLIVSLENSSILQNPNNTE